MPTIDLSFDRSAFERGLEVALREDLGLAVADLINEADKAAQEAVRQAMRSGLEEPTPFTLDGVRFFPTRARTTGGRIDALVFLADAQAGYLDLQMHPRTRRAGSPGTTKLGPLVPGPAAPRDRFGNLPRGYVASVAREPNVVWVTLRPGAPPTLVRSALGGGLEILALIATQTRYDTVWFDFHGMVFDAVEDALRDVS